MERMKYNHVDALVKRCGGIRASEEWRAIRSYIMEAGQPAHNIRVMKPCADCERSNDVGDNCAKIPFSVCYLCKHTHKDYYSQRKAS